MMIRNFALLCIIILIVAVPVHAQVYFTKNGHIAFFSKTILEDISADNNQVISVMNIQTGEIRFSLLNKAFHFPKAKMEEDFNEDYMESQKYPASTFTGNVAHISDIDFSKNGNFPVSVTGDLLIHGVTRTITVPGRISIENGKISAFASFKILPADYKIRIPSIVSNKISESIELTIDCSYLKK
jgi:hypothetical protein